MDRTALVSNARQQDDWTSGLITYICGAVPAAFIGGVIGLYSAERLQDSVEVLREASVAVRMLVDGGGVAVGGLLGDCVGGFSAIAYSTLRLKRLRR